MQLVRGKCRTSAFGSAEYNAETASSRLCHDFFLHNTEVIAGFDDKYKERFTSYWSI